MSDDRVSDDRVSEGEDPLDEWVQAAQPMIMHLEAFQVPRDVKLDFGPASLAQLEAAVLDRFAAVDDLDDDDEQGFVDGAVAYIGEALLRVTGGSWIWDAGTGCPVARPDGALELAPVSPRRLLAAAVDTRDGTQIGAVYAAWSAAVEELTARRPDWQPVKQPTPGLDRPPSSESFQLARWLAQRAAGFADWVQRYAPDSTWDFSPGSLDALEAVVRRTTPTDDALDDPSNKDFADGAAWYLGEVMSRRLGGRWLYREDEPGGPDALPYMDLPGPRIRVFTPLVYLKIALDQPGFLRQRLTKFSS